MSTARGSSRPLRSGLMPVAAAGALALACLPASTLFSDGDWAGPALLTIALVCAVGGVLRALPVPIAAIPVAQTAVFLAAMAYLLPQTGGLGARLAAFRDLALDGAAAVRSSSAPVASTAEIAALLVVAVFIGALLVETLAVGLGWAGLSGAVLLVMVAVPAGLSTPSLLLVAAPAVGWLLLMAADQSARLRVKEPTGPAGSRVRHAARLGPGAGLFLIMAAGVCSGVVIATSAPTAGSLPWLLSLSDRAGGEDIPASGSIDPFVDIRERLEETNRQREVLSYTSSDGRPSYLGMVTLELFNGQTWTPYPRAAGSDSRVASAQGADASLAPGPTFDVRVASLGNPYLPVPDYARTVTVAQGPGSWGWDRNTGDVVSTRTPATGLEYRVETFNAAPDAGALAAAGSQGQGVSAAARRLSDELAVAVAPTAAQTTAGSTSNYERALKLQEWFTRTGGFEYTLTVPDPGERDPVVAFLADRQGFCQQYATAMAVLARSLDIPARVVVGFAGGSQQDDGSFVVTGGDAHAWPELWFDDIGWVRFEPTPAAVNPSVVAPAYASPEGPAPPEPTPTPSAIGASPAPAAQPGQEASGLRRLAPAAVAGSVLGVLALVGLAVPPAVRKKSRKDRLADLAEGDAGAAWTEIRDTAVDAGIAWANGATTRQQAAGVVDAIDPPAPGGWPALASVVAAVEERLYAPAMDRAAVPGYRSAAATILDEPWMQAGPDDLAEDVDDVLRRLDAIPRRLSQRMVPRSLRRRAVRR